MSLSKCLSVVTPNLDHNRFYSKTIEILIKSENADVDFDPQKLFFENTSDSSNFATKIMGIRLETVENGRNTFLIEKWTKLIWDPSQTPDFKKFVRAPEWSDSTEINFGVQIHTYTIQENQVWDDSDL